MSLLKDIMTEMAAGGATGGGAIGGVRGSLFGGGVITRHKKMLKNIERLQTREINSLNNSIKNRNTMKWRMIGEMMDQEQFDASDVMSKLDAAEKAANNQDDTVPFGLEDDEGNIVKVYVQADQADEFESALSMLLAGADENNDEEMQSTEIAEVLFRLKDRFNIVDVEWPRIETDEEAEETEGVADGEEMDAEGGDELDLEGGEGGDEELDLEGGDEEMDLEGGDELDLEGGDDMAADDSGAEGALQQVIDMMKADAEARKAESEARAAEAEARAAEAHASSAASKVEQEEQVLDMEQYNKNQKKMKDETERLAKLAKYKHDMARDAETQMASEENEEQMAEDPKGQISMDALADMIVSKLRGSIQ